VEGFAGTFYITWQKVLPAGMKKVCKDKAFNASGYRCFLFARNPEIFSGIRVGKRMVFRLFGGCAGEMIELLK
jgi:hypothetical protein